MKNLNTPSNTPPPSHLRLAVCLLLGTSCTHGEQVHIDTTAPCERPVVDNKCPESEAEKKRKRECEEAEEYCNKEWPDDPGIRGECILSMCEPSEEEIMERECESRRKECKQYTDPLMQSECLQDCDPEEKNK